MTPFQKEIQSNVLKTISKLKKAGTVKMGIRNLMAVTPTPKAIIGAPMGTNSEFVYRQMFDEICNGNNKIKSFLLPDRMP